MPVLIPGLLQGQSYNDGMNIQTGSPVTGTVKVKYENVRLRLDDNGQLQPAMKPTGLENLDAYIHHKAAAELANNLMDNVQARMHKVKDLDGGEADLAEELPGHVVSVSTDVSEHVSKDSKCVLTFDPESGVIESFGEQQQGKTRHALVQNRLRYESGDSGWLIATNKVITTEYDGLERTATESATLTSSGGVLNYNMVMI